MRRSRSFEIIMQSDVFVMFQKEKRLISVVYLTLCIHVLLSSSSQGGNRTAQMLLTRGNQIHLIRLQDAAPSGCRLKVCS